MSSPWNAESVLNLARGFMEPRLLLTAAELDLFTLLGPAPLSLAEIAAHIDALPQRLAILLDGLAAMELLVKRDDTYQTRAELAPLLTLDSNESVLPMVLHAARLWEGWGELTERVGGKRRLRTSDEDDLRAFIAAMHVVGVPQADRVVAAVRPAQARHLLDVGGGSGTYTLAFLRAVPEMRATLFDRPLPLEMARERLGAAGLADRVTLVAGDFFADPLPGGCDLAFLSAIIHQNSPKQNLELYKKTLQALRPGGRIVIRDHVLSADRTQPRSGAIFAVNMLALTEGGNNYTLEEMLEGLAGAGFIGSRLIQPDTRMDGLVEAFRPA
jgi:predicted O-methyltransferase YrrM